MCNKDSSLLGCYVVSTGKLTFQMSIVFPVNMLEHPPTKKTESSATPLWEPQSCK